MQKRGFDRSKMCYLTREPCYQNSKYVLPSQPKARSFFVILSSLSFFLNLSFFRMYWPICWKRTRKSLLPQSASTQREVISLTIYWEGGLHLTFTTSNARKALRDHVIFCQDTVQDIINQIWERHVQVINLLLYYNGFTPNAAHVTPHIFINPACFRIFYDLPHYLAISAY